MAFGFGDSLKKIRKELKKAKVDKTFLRKWQKGYDRLRKKLPKITEEYDMALRRLEDFYELLEQMETACIERRMTKAEAKRFRKELNAYKQAFSQELLIGTEDVEFHSTVESICGLCMRDLSEEKTRLLLHSEIENLLAVTKEALQKTLPDRRALAFFLIDHKEAELSELPHVEKVARIESFYEEEFVLPFARALEGRMEKKRIREILEVELW